MTTKRPGRTKNTDWAKCKAEGCALTVEGGSLGFCNTHYMAVRRYNTFDTETGARLSKPKRVAAYAVDATCSVADCERGVKSNGFCGAHFQRWRAGKDLNEPIQDRSKDHRSPPCSVSGCPRRAYRQSLCNPHFQQVDLGQPIILEIAAKDMFNPCIVSGCIEKTRSMGMCHAHAKQRAVGILDAAGNKLREPRHNKNRRKERWHGQEGYVCVKAPEGHPNARQDGSILEHRLVAEQFIGRYLTEWEIVHHKNGVRSDNRPENLEVMDGRAGSPGPGHPPGHDYTPDYADQVLTALRLSNPEGFNQMLEKIKTYAPVPKRCPQTESDPTNAGELSHSDFLKIQAMADKMNQSWETGNES